MTGPTHLERTTTRIVSRSGSFRLPGAANAGHIAANVVIKKDKREGKLQIGTDIPAPAEIQRLLRAAEGAEMKIKTLLAVAIFTGLRSSELLGLRWSDVDFKNAELHVRQRADRFKKIGLPKSEAGTRSVDFGPRLLAMLKEWKLACPKGEADLVFPDANGEVWYHKAVSRKLETIMGAAGLTDLPGGGKLLVSRGIGMERGYAPPMRFLCRPELMVIDLTPEEKETTDERR